MKKLIYLDDAIDAVSRGCGELRGIFAECEKNLNELPSSFPCPEGFNPAHPTEQDKKDILEALEWVKGKITEELPSAQPEEDCDSCKHGYFGDWQCDNCRVRYPSHYERRTDGE